MRHSVLVLLFGAVAWAAAQQTAVEPASGWFPIQPGNYWVYQSDKGAARALRMEVGEPVVRDGRQYYSLSNPFGPDLLVRNVEGGRVEAFDADDGDVTLWYDFEATAGWKAGGQLCTSNARVADRDATVTTPAGEFAGALRIAYSPGGCFDAGTTNETFARGVGMVEHAETTIAGPVRYRLIEARVSGRLYKAQD